MIRMLINKKLTYSDCFHVDFDRFDDRRNYQDMIECQNNAYIQLRHPWLDSSKELSFKFVFFRNQIDWKRSEK